MDGLMDGWMDGWICKLKDGWMDLMDGSSNIQIRCMQRQIYQ